MQIETITPELPVYEEIQALYERSFPADQRLPFPAFQDLLKKGNTSFLAFYDQENLAGFAHLFHYENYSILSYLAVNDKLRGRGLGSQILSQLQKHFPNQTIIAEIEQPDETASNQAQRLQRRRFYERNGFQPTGYHIDYDGLQFDIYFDSRDFDPDKYYQVYAQSFPGHGYRPIKNEDSQ